MLAGTALRWHPRWLEPLAQFLDFQADDLSVASQPNPDLCAVRMLADIPQGFLGYPEEGRFDR